MLDSHSQQEGGTVNGTPLSVSTNVRYVSHGQAEYSLTVPPDYKITTPFLRAILACHPIFNLPKTIRKFIHARDVDEFII